MTKTYSHAVTGDFSRLVYSRHRSYAAARRAAQALARKWGPSHLGAEPRVVEISDSGLTDPAHVLGGESVAADVGPGYYDVVEVES